MRIKAQTLKKLAKTHMNLSDVAVGLIEKNAPREEVGRLLGLLKDIADILIDTLEGFAADLDERGTFHEEDGEVVMELLLIIPETVRRSQGVLESAYRRWSGKGRKVH